MSLLQSLSTISRQCAFKCFTGVWTDAESDFVRHKLNRIFDTIVFTSKSEESQVL